MCVCVCVYGDMFAAMQEKIMRLQAERDAALKQVVFVCVYMHAYVHVYVYNLTAA